MPELSNFVFALLQGEALGMPIGRVMNTQAEEMRGSRRRSARDKTGKLPVRILLPLVVFLHPAVMIVVLAPAFASVGRNLR